MSAKINLFFTTVQWSLSRLLPHRRQQLLHSLEQFAEDLPDAPCCQDLLEIWAENYGHGGLILGNLALFALGFLGMILLDHRLWRTQNVKFSLIGGLIAGLYNLFKFKTAEASTGLLILLLCLFWMICGFWWSIAFAFLVYFTNMGAIHALGGNKC